MSYHLLSGGTGLLGRYLLKDLTLADVPLAVVVRSTKWESAAQRIETAMATWEKDLGRPLVRPVVLEGDISQADVGLSPRDLAWVEAHCSTMIHSAASLTFNAEPSTGEPWRSNVEGTRNVLGLCRRAGLREYHHVSTAYVCGKRRGRILETELDCGQEFGNEYEQSKFVSESEVRASHDFDRVTVYRPSIIVGDSKTGYTTSYHGFYTPLRLVYSLLRTVPWATILRNNWLADLDLGGDERKNLVAVDWVSAAIAALVSHPEHHGKTYHLTNPKPETTQSMRLAMGEALGEMAQKNPVRANSALGDDFTATFREPMAIYKSYWSDDPQFDSTNTQAALPHLPCPVVDYDVMDRLIRFAMAANFGWPREAPIVPAFEVRSQLHPWLEREEQMPAETDALRYVSLRVSGPGGGQWHLAVEQGRIVHAGKGLSSGPGPTCHLTSETFAELARGAITLEDSIRTGRVTVAGNSVPGAELARCFHELAERGQREMSPASAS